MTCQSPHCGVWGGPPNGGTQEPAVAKELAFVDRTGNLGTFIAQDVPEIKFAVNMPPPVQAPAIWQSAAR